MGQVTRLLRNNLVGGSGTDDVYPITSTTAVIQPGTNKTVEELLAAVNRQNDVRSIRNTEIVNSGRTLRFTYTDGDIEEVDLPETVKAISIQKNGDTNIMTITGTNGNTQVLNFAEGKEYDVIPATDNVHVRRVENETSERKTVIFEVSVDKQNVEIPTVNNGKLTIKQGSAVLGEFTANQSGNITVDIPTVSGEQGATGATGAKGDKGDKGDDGKSAYQIAVDNGFTGTETEWLESLKGKNGTNGTNGTDANVTVTNNNPTLSPNTNKTVGTVKNVNLTVQVPNFVLNDGGCAKLKYLTKEEYDALATKDSTTIYFIPVSDDSN